MAVVKKTFSLEGFFLCFAPAPQNNPPRPASSRVAQPDTPHGCKRREPYLRPGVPFVLGVGAADFADGGYADGN